MVVFDSALEWMCEWILGGGIKQNVGLGLQEKARAGFES